MENLVLKDALYCLRCPDSEGKKLCEHMGHDDCDMPFEDVLFYSKGCLWKFTKGMSDYDMENGLLIYHGPGAVMEFI